MEIVRGFWTILVCGAALLMGLAGVESAFAQYANDAANAIVKVKWDSPLVVVECVWLFLVAVGLPIYSYWSGKCADQKELRGLNMSLVQRYMIVKRRSDSNAT